MEDFTPVSGFVGGLLIALAVALLLWLNGRLAGISGIVGGLVLNRTGDLWWRATFLAGLVLGAFGYGWTFGGPGTVEVTASLPTKTRPDGRLLSDAALFGVGWGMVGFCPGRRRPLYGPRLRHRHGTVQPSARADSGGGAG